MLVREDEGVRGGLEVYLGRMQMLREWGELDQYRCVSTSVRCNRVLGIQQGIVIYSYYYGRYIVRLDCQVEFSQGVCILQC